MMKSKIYSSITREMIANLGESALEAWTEITTFLNGNYDFHVEARKDKNGWEVKYRRSGKTLCALYPKEKVFTVLIVLGKKEVEEVTKAQSSLGSYISNIFKTAKQYHDGRWLWITVSDELVVGDIKKLLIIKKKPRRK